MDFEETRKIIAAKVDHENFVMGLGGSRRKLEFGDYVISGINAAGQQVIGYVVQIREKWGAFGSNTYFIRDHEGGLATHENQSFWKLTENQIEMILPHFGGTPEEEKEANPELRYTVANNEYPESGFYIEPDNAPDRVDRCTMAITVSNTGNNET